MIEKVEIITNPSARYEAEGMSGIINIILKKEQKQCFNGSFELISGNPANYGVSANVNYRKEGKIETGLRAELTNVTTTLKQTNEVNPIDYANLFPSTHFTLNLANENALQISYSRRVRTIIEGVNFYSYRDFLPRQDKSI